MKKIIASVLSLTIACSAMCVAIAADNNEPENITEPITIAQELCGAKTTHIGTVEEIGDGYITLKDIDLILNTDSNTYISDFSLAPYEGLKAGDEVMVVSNTATTRSIPPQSYASYILVKTNDTDIAPIFATVASNNGEEIMSDDGQNRIIISDKTEVAAHKIKIALKANDITPGSEIFAFADHVGLSLPAYVVPEKIVVMKLVTESSVDVSGEEENADSSYTITVDNDMVIYTSDLPYSAYKEGESVMVPLRKIAEALGYTVEWSSDSGKITVISDSYITELYSGDTATILTDKSLSSQNAQNIELEKAPIIHDGHTYVPLTFFTCFGNTASLNGTSITIMPTK